MKCLRLIEAVMSEIPDNIGEMYMYTYKTQAELNQIVYNNMYMHDNDRQVFAIEKMNGTEKCTTLQHKCNQQTKKTLIS